MKALKNISIVLGILIVLMMAFLGYMGVFSTLKVTEREMGPYTIVYERFVGEYKDTGKVFDKVGKAVKGEGIETVNGLGIYYDDPKVTPKDKLRSDCGVVLESKDVAKAAMLKAKKFNVMTLPKKMCLVAEFPIRNVISYMIGPSKAYPALTKYAEEKSYKMAITYELYDMPANKIYFIMEIAK